MAKKAQVVYEDLTTATHKLAWHFVGTRLRDRQPVPADGVELRHDTDIVWCRSGLYASETLWCALRWGPQLVKHICRVRCEDIQRTDYCDRKFVCRRRTILWRVEARPVLDAFVRRCALDVSHVWGAPRVVTSYLRSGDERLREPAAQVTREYSARLTPMGPGHGIGDIDKMLYAALEVARLAIPEGYEPANPDNWAPVEKARTALWVAALATHPQADLRAAQKEIHVRANRRLTSMVMAAHRRAQ